jgi:hypothetical protein
MILYRYNLELAGESNPWLRWFRFVCPQVIDQRRFRGSLRWDLPSHWMYSSLGLIFFYFRCLFRTDNPFSFCFVLRFTLPWSLDRNVFVHHRTFPKCPYTCTKIHWLKVAEEICYKFKFLIWNVCCLCLLCSSSAFDFMFRFGFKKSFRHH